MNARVNGSSDLIASLSAVRVRQPTWRERCVASDPGSVRLALAVRAVSSIVVVVGALAGVTALLGLTGTPRIVALVLGAILTLVSTFTVADPTVGGRVTTQLSLPAAMLAAVALSATLDRFRVVSLVAFVLVMIVVVWVRRFGPRAFACGMVAWIGYFVTLFLQLRPAMVPVAALGVATATVVLLVLQVLVAPQRPARRLRRMVSALRARVLIARRERDGSALLRVNEAAVLVDGQLAIPGALTRDASAPAVRAAVLRVELALAALLEAEGRDGPGTDPSAAREVDAALLRLDDVLTADRAGAAVTRADAAPERGFVPGAALFGGFLPGSAVTVGTMFGPDAVHTGASGRLALTSRQALQIGVASALAIGLGLLVSGQRWYWAVLACFLAFTGTATAAETAIKAGQRVLGTAVGVALALLVVPLFGQSVPIVLAVMLVALFLGFYLFRISYTVLALAVTVMVAELYQLMGTYSEQLLLLRVAETLLGAAVGAVVAMTFLPAPARRAEGAARAQLAEGLRDALADVATMVRDHPRSEIAVADLHARLRALDADLHQLALIGGPLVRRTIPVRRRTPTTVQRRLAAWTTCAVRVRAVVHAVEDAMVARGRTGSAAGPPVDRTRVTRAVTAVHGLAEGLLVGEAPVRSSPRGEQGSVLREVAALHGALVALHEIDTGGPVWPDDRTCPGVDLPAGDDAPRALPPGGAAVPTPRPAAVPGLARLTGHVASCGVGIPDAVVTLIDHHGRQHGRARAVDGRYELVLPGAGTWQVLAVAPGHAPRADRLVVGARSHAVVHDLSLAPRPARR